MTRRIRSQIKVIQSLYTANVETKTGNNVICHAFYNPMLLIPSPSYRLFDRFLENYRIKQVITLK